MLTAVWIIYLVALGILAVYGVHRLFLTIQSWRTRGQVHACPPLGDDLPVVTVQLPLFNERYVVERLLDAVAALAWPKERLHIQVLDDSTDDTVAICRAKVASLRAAGHDIEYLHRRQRIGFKAGALAAGLCRAKGHLLLVLDADFVPPTNLLRDTVGYFADSEIGMVQVRWEHLNRSHSALTQVQALLLDGHFAIEQAVRGRTGRFFNFNGTAGVWRRKAVEQSGGWQHDTLTEDLDLSYRALLHGWRFVYLLGHAAPAELPADMNAFKSQQFRWAKGSVQVARKLLPRILTAPVTTKIKVEAFFHLTQNVPYLICLCLLLAAGPALVLRPSQGVETLWLHAPMFLGTALTLGTYCAMSQHALGRSIWRALCYIPVLVAVTVGISVNQARAVVEGAIGHCSEFVRTPKHGMGGAPHKWQGARYRGLRSWTSVIEVSLAGYFLVFAVLACMHELWLVVPPLALFAAGFAYVGFRSVMQT